MVRIELRGFENVSQVLRKKVVLAAERAMPEMVQAGGMVIANEARILAPKRTSTLANSIDVREIQREGNLVAAKIGPSADVPYARIQEYGGTIAAKEKMLKVPISQAAKEGRAPERLVLVHADGGPFLMDPVTELFHYVLRASVTLPSHAYMRPAADTQQENMKTAMSLVLGRAVNGP